MKMQSYFDFGVLALQELLVLPVNIFEMAQVATNLMPVCTFVRY